MKELQDLARQLLSEKKVQVVIGWEEGPRGPRPAFITSPEEAGRLIFDTGCVHNLATYLNPRRKHLSRLGRAAVVIKGCDARAVAGLVRETQLKREDLVVIGVRCGGVKASAGAAEPLSQDNVADRCASCESREPRFVDHLVGELPPAPPASTRRTERIAALEALAPQERWDFWQNELSRCVLCHACREVCPMCFCERCVADKTEPQWIESSAHPRAIFAWHVTRALHQAGRCVDCGECQRACPADIPLGLLNKKLAEVVAGRFAYRATDDPGIPAPIGAYKLDDAQEFIL
jgi:ferredoxin